MYFLKHSFVGLLCSLLFFQNGYVLGKKPTCPSQVQLPIYLKTYGNCLHKPLLYLHGGPGDSAFLFEYSTAQKLAKQGYFVVVYDRRGTGRSPSAKSSAYTLDTAVQDLYQIIQQFRIKKEVYLLGHSFGGWIGARFLERYPKVKARLILLSAPISFPATLQTLLERFITLYPSYIRKARANKQKRLALLMAHALRYSTVLKKSMYKRGKPVPRAFSMRNVGFIFMTALRFRLYTPKTLTKDAKALYKKILSQGPPRPSAAAFRGFIKNENYAALSYSKLIKKHQAKIYGIYGKLDGLFSSKTIHKIKGSLLPHRFQWMPRSGHNPFLDQQSKCIDWIKKYTK